MSATGTKHERAGGIAADFDAIVDEILGRHPTVGLAVGLVSSAGLRDFRTHGVADIDEGSPITEDTVFWIASITKTFTAIAVMQLWEQGLIDLDAPAKAYLQAYELTPANPDHRPATVRHLLTHTAGMPEVAHSRGIVGQDFGESFAAGERMPSLAEFYGGRIVLSAEPGTRFVYNNHGPSTLGQIVEDVSGMSLGEYFRQYIFDPLGMSASDLSKSDQVVSRLATGYEIASRGVKRIVDRNMVTAGAASIYSSPRDMARYLAALLSGGSNDHGAMLQAGSVDTMFEPHYRPDPRIPGMGLGFFRYGLSGRRCVGHQGTHPGFHSQIMLAPDDDIAVMLFTNGAAQADFWLPAEAKHLLEWLLDLPDGVRSEVPHHPELWGDLCGWYRLSARLTDIRLRGMMGAGAEVLVGGGRLMLRFLTPIPSMAKGFPLLPVDDHDPYAFQIDLSEFGLEPMQIVFGQSAEGVTDRLCLDVMPLVLDKQPEASNPRRWALGVVGVTAATSIACWRRASG